MPNNKKSALSEKISFIVVLTAALILSLYFINCNKAPECQIVKVNKTDQKANIHTNLKEGEKIRVIEFDEQQRTVRSWTGYVDNEGKLEIKIGEMETSNVLKCDYCK